MNEMRKLMETAKQLTEQRAIRAKPSTFGLQFDDEFGVPDYEGIYVDFETIAQDELKDMLDQLAKQVAPFGLKVYWAFVEELSGYLWKVSK